MSHELKIPMSANDALAILKESNERFVTGHPKYSYAEGMASDPTYDVSTQAPIAVVHTCSDSRVKARLVFDQPLGKLFQTVTAGQVSDRVVLGSIEYTVQHLGTRLIIVLGHSDCGAVKASMQGAVDPATSHIGVLTEVIRPRIEGITDVAEAVKAHVRAEVAKFAADPFVMAGSEAGSEKEIKVLGAYLDLASGKVEFLD